MHYSFGSAFNFGQPLWLWNTSCVKDMGWMFGAALKPMRFNHDINRWDVSSVSTLSGMFTLKLPFWLSSAVLTADVLDTRYMFSATPVFNQDISFWNVGKPHNAFETFYYASLFILNRLELNFSLIVQLLELN